MVDPTTTNRGYAIPTRGSDVGQWDTPVNNDFTLIDQNLGAVTTVPLTNAPVTLNAAQYACGTIRLTGTLTADLTLIFPQVSAWWTVDNQTTGNFVVQLVCNPGANRIGIPQGVASDVFTDGANIGFRSLSDVGSYKDYAGTSVPRWVSFCTIAPWLLCDGSTFSAVTFPILAQVLGGTTLPDFRGRDVFFMNGGTSRITSAGAGLDGDTLFAVNNNNGISLAANQIPTLTSASAGVITVNFGGNVPRTAGTISGNDYNNGSGPLGANFPSSTAGGLGDWNGISSASTSGTISVSYTNNSQVKVPLTAPGIMGGIRMIRAG